MCSLSNSIQASAIQKNKKTKKNPAVKFQLDLKLHIKIGDGLEFCIYYSYFVYQPENRDVVSEIPRPCESTTIMTKRGIVIRLRVVWWVLSRSLISKSRKKAACNLTPSAFSIFPLWCFHTKCEHLEISKKRAQRIWTEVHHETRVTVNQMEVWHFSSEGWSRVCVKGRMPTAPISRSWLRGRCICCYG